MNPVDDKSESVTIRAVSHDEEGKKHVEKVELTTHNIDTIKHVGKKLVDKGIQRMERHPTDGLSFKRQPHKSGHGGKYTWEGPVAEAEAEMDPLPAAIDERDPNYVEEEEEAVEGVGEVEVAKVAAEGVGRLDVDPRLSV